MKNSTGSKKKAKSFPWLDEAPAWEQREATRHFDPERDVIVSSFLDQPLPHPEALRRRRRGEPLEYILGHVHLGGRRLRCDPRALIPRPETETLARRFTDRLSEMPAGPIVDCGTGTGVLADWVAARSSRDVIAVDRDPGALELARDNRRPGSHYALMQGDRLEAVGRGVAGVVANLPYVERGGDDLEESVRRFEPDGALYYPGDGESFYGGFLRRAAAILRPDGQLWMELDPGWIERLTRRARAQTEWRRIVSHRDLADKPRFLQLIAS